MSEMHDCPQCNKRHVSWDARCGSWLCLTIGCGYSTKVYPRLKKENGTMNGPESLYSLRFPNGFKIDDESALSEMYVKDRIDCEATGNIKFLISKWQFLCPSIQGKTNINNDDVLVPRELLHLAIFARKFGVSEGLIFFQLINSGKLTVDQDGFVRSK